MGDKDKYRGLYGKYEVRRLDRQDDRYGKHYRCRYFVLDLDHDPHALPAIEAYATSCAAAGYDKLALDLRDVVRRATT